MENPSETTQILEQIQLATRAHIAWKIRLKTAISTAKSETTPEDAKCDTDCQFGKWLHGDDLSETTKDGMPYKVIKRLHAEFHQEASVVPTHALSGNKEKSTEVLDNSFTERSHKLVRALGKWKRELM